MASSTSKAQNSSFSLRAHQGDAKTLLAFNLEPADAKNLAGFSIQCQPGTGNPYYLWNNLRFANPGDHAQVAGEPPQSTANAPIHKFRWLHVPGSFHQGLQPFFGDYTYTVTPRYFDDAQHMQPIDASLSAQLTIPVVPFDKGTVKLGFTRGFTQSQAFVGHFGATAPIQPRGADLLFDTSAKAGDANGASFTFDDEYAWLGFTARERIFDILNDVIANQNLQLDMFAFDLNEPRICELLLQLAAQGRLRMILDNSSEHHDNTGKKREDDFETRFNGAKTGQADLKRGKFARFAHDKILIVSDGATPVRVLTGSTNFSVTGLYVNSNHVLVFDDPTVAGRYSAVFNRAWDIDVSAPSFRSDPLANNAYSFDSQASPPTDVTFAPHDPDFVDALLQAIADRVASEGNQPNGSGSVLFAVMDLGGGGSGPILPALDQLHANQSIFSFGISDNPAGICLYARGSTSGVLVTGKPTKTKLPPPFNQVPGVAGHQIHHKFIVCGFTRPDAVVYCGSSNLAAGGENANGDNLLAIHDSDVATAFAIEAVGLVDHFNFLDSFANQAPGTAAADAQPPASKAAAAEAVGWFLSTTDAWTAPYFDANDLHCMDRELFG